MDRKINAVKLRRRRICWPSTVERKHGEEPESQGQMACMLPLSGRGTETSPCLSFLDCKTEAITQYLPQRVVVRI